MFLSYLDHNRQGKVRRSLQSRSKHSLPPQTVDKLHRKGLSVMLNIISDIICGLITCYLLAELIAELTLQFHGWIISHIRERKSSTDISTGISPVGLQFHGRIRRPSKVIPYALHFL